MSRRTHKRIENELKDLINERGNSNKCGECDATFPTWASVNLGIFLCGRCASMHRKLGSDVSVVKSLTHDRWTDDDLDSMAAMGNKKAKRLWNPKKVPFPFDDDDKDEVFMYFRNKYVLGKYRDSAIDPEDYNLGDSHRRRSSSRASSSREIPRLSHRDIPELERFKYRKQEPRLKSMGFKNTDDIYEALVLARGDVTLAADILSKSEGVEEKKPPLPKRPGTSGSVSSAPATQSGNDWWAGANGSAVTSAGSAQPALFDGTAAPATGTIPVDANGLIEPPQQYLDPATGIIYVDPVHQQQYELQQQQLMQQQQGALFTQKTGVDKSALMSLYNQPTAGAQQTQAFQPQQTQAFQQQQQYMQPQQTAFSQFSGFPQQTGAQFNGQQTGAQFNGYQTQQFTGAVPQFTGFQQPQQNNPFGYQ